MPEELSMAIFLPNRDLRIRYAARPAKVQNSSLAFSAKIKRLRGFI